MWRNVRLLFAKEIIGAARDRRTMLLIVIFPLLFYPMILAVLGNFTATEQTRLEQMLPTIGVVDTSNDDQFLLNLQQTRNIAPIFYATTEQAKTALSDEVVQVAMSVAKEQGGPGVGLDITLYYDQTSQEGTIAASKVRDFLREYLDQVLEQKLDKLGLNYDELSPPMKVTVEDTATSITVGRMIMSRMLPYFMVLAILTGAMGLGAEITAGEKERGTIATLLVSQLTRTQIVLGKFFTVLAVSVVSSILSAVGLVTGIHLFGQKLAPAGSSATFSLGTEAIGWILAILVPLAVILSALVIIVGTFARNQKEASTYLMPAYMVIVLVGLVSMTGGMSFSGMRFLIPVANALYLLQEVINADMQLIHFLYTFVGNALCGSLLITLSTILFKREGVLFRS